MSMCHVGSSGYTVKVDDLLKIIPTENRKEFAEVCEFENDETILEYLNKILPSQYPKPKSVFILQDDDESEELEIGVLYAYFDESSLYVKKLTREGECLVLAGIKPTFNNWVNFY